jgi:N-acetylglucosaminyl-diphospho-decaprenol L-rhamnosyltransferase
MLDVVIVSAPGGRELLRDALQSLERHPLSAGTSRVQVVDNASRDGTVEMLAAEFESVACIALERDAGFAGANNVALRRATAPTVLLLNPDTELSAGALDAALEALRERPEVAVLGVRLVRPDGSFDHAAKRSFPTPLGAIGHFTGLGRGPSARGRLAQYRAPDLDEHERGEVDAVNGAFMLVRRAAIEQVGLLDEAYGMYGEDLDWCYRFKKAGWKVWYEGGITVVHVKGATSVVETAGGPRRGLAMNVAFHRAMGRFYRKFQAGPNPALDAAVYAGIGTKLFASVLRSAFARGRIR